MSATTTATATGNNFLKVSANDNNGNKSDVERSADERVRTEHFKANPKDSMKSTWRNWPAAAKTIDMHVIDFLGLAYCDKDREIPVHQKTDKMPYLPHRETHKWVLAHALWPLAVHQLYIWVMGKNMPYLAVLLFYIGSFHFNAIHEIHSQRELGHQHGFLDGDKKGRDDVPDRKAGPILSALHATATIRPMISVLWAYRSSNTTPFLFTKWVPIEIGLYPIVLDFYYYWYHRILHESDALWKHHRTHHLTKRPTALLSLYADGIQEIFDIIGIPFLTYATLRVMGMPMTFSDWWMCQQYVVWTELWGHSGLRILATPPTTATPLLKLFNAELVTEDHDLHHRKGWKDSHNYGKQTRLWDRVFGTCHERYETLEENIDWNRPVALPLWGGEFK